MPTIIYEGIHYHCRETETVLDALLRQGVAIPFSCRNGICHVCLMRCESGQVDERAQAGLKPGLQALGYFLPCSTRPQQDLVIAPPRPEDLYIQAIVNSKKILNSSVCRLLLEPATDSFDYHPGQFINLRRSDGLTRSYSLASIPGDYFLELHIRRRRNGQLSNWIFDELQVNDELEIHGPSGDNFYQPDNRDQPLLLIATGTGVAPLWGILRDALDRGHTGPIQLYHGSHDREGLYLHDTLKEMQLRYPNLQYHPCLSGQEVPSGIRAGRADVIALAEQSMLSGWRVHIAGVPAMVYATRDAVLGAGARETDVLADPFELTDLRRQHRTGPVAEPRADISAPSQEAPWKKPEIEIPAPDPALWTALQDGALLGEILSDFYTRVYADPRLSPFFTNVTRQRLIEKQYSFLKRAITGELCYFGERPRNAHHWMVISDDLFDYRDELLRQTARDHGLDEQWIARWHKIEEAFRADIVKATAWPRVVDGVETGFDGFGEIVMDEGSLCNSCGQAIAKGETVRYHLRTGDSYCTACAAMEAASGKSSSGT